VKLHFIRVSLVPEFTVRDCCRVLGVSESGYYRLVKVPVGKREAQARTLNAQVAAVHDACGGIYGSPRVYNELRKMGVKASRKAGIRSRMHRKFRVKTTDSNHTNPIAPNLLNRNFTMDMPNRAWASDVTYIPTREGFAYLATVMDLFSRKIVGWATAGHLRTQMVADALNSALLNRQIFPDLIFTATGGASTPARSTALC